MEMIRWKGRSLVALCRTIVCVTFVLSAQVTVAVAADEEESTDPKNREEILATKRFELMRDRVTAARVQSTEEGFPAQFDAKPIFKYNDPARAYVSAAVWKLGDEGRPKALIASELHRQNFGRPAISYEYISMTKTPFTVTADDIKWTPKGTLFEFKPLPKMAAPEATPQRRLKQIRDAANRFGSHEIVAKEKCQLRLLSQPVMRYTPSKAPNADGAVFFFTFGTNPEVILMIESDGQAWNYSVGRMTGAEEVVLTLDEIIVWEGPPLQHGLSSPSTGDVFAVDIPGLASDGRELKE